jgi:glycosyltransferase involved in cell wall biosynthesis
MAADRPLRILHLLNNLSDRGNGIVNVAVDLAMCQARRGMVVGFASGGGGYTSLLSSAGVQCLLAPQAGAASALKNSFGLLKVLRRFRPDAVHTHMRSGVALVWPWARWLKVPLVMHLHNVHDRDYGLSHLPQRVIAVSDSVRCTLVEQGVPAARVSVVLNGTLGSERLPPVTTPAVLHRPAIVTVAGMTQRKGLAELIQAFARLPGEHTRTHLYLVGGGDEQAAFERLAAGSGVGDRIHFEGFQSDPRSYLASADLFVLASRRESFGLAILEARAAGCAILATNVDGIPELLDQGRCGVLTPPHDPAGLAAQMSRILQDQNLQQRLRREATRGLERYTVERMSSEVLAIYMELLRENKPAGALIAPDPAASTGP